MSKRGRRRNSKRRKSSSSSKQSVSPYIFQKQNKNEGLGYKHEMVEKGETDSLWKENAPSGSDNEEECNNTSPKEKKQDYQMDSFPKPRNIYTKTTEDKEKGVKIVTSVSVSDIENAFPKIMFQQSHEPLAENANHSSSPVTNIMEINCSGSHVNLEIQDILQINTSGIRTTLVFTNDGDCAEKLLNNKFERTWLPNSEPSEHPSQNVARHNGNQKTKYRFTFQSMKEQTETYSDSKSVRLIKMWDNPNYSQCLSDHKQQLSSDFILENHPLNINSLGDRNCFHKRVSTDQFWDIPPPQEFADIKYNSLEDLTLDLASLSIEACSPAYEHQREIHQTPNINCNKDSGCPFSVEVENEEKRILTSPSFDQLSESDNCEPMLMRLPWSTNRSSFTKDFINHQKRKSWIRNNSIATVEHKACLSQKRRRQTYPGMSLRLQEDLLQPLSESFSSLIMCLLPLQTVGLENVPQCDDRFPEFGLRNSNSSQTNGSSKPVSEILNSYERKQPLLCPFYMTNSEDNPSMLISRQVGNSCHHKDLGQQATDLKQDVCEDKDSMERNDSEYRVDQIYISDSGFNQEMREFEYLSQEPHKEELSGQALAIQLIPPSCSGSEEQMLQSNPVILLQKNDAKYPSQENLVSVLPKHAKSSVMTITVGALEQNFLQNHSRLSVGSCMEKHTGAVMEDPCTIPLQDINVHSLNTNEVTEETQSKPFGKDTRNISPSVSLMIKESNYLQLNTEERNTENLDKLTDAASCPGKCFTDTESKEELSKTDKADKQIASRSSLDAKDHLKPVVTKDPDSGCSDHWAKRRKLFKESKQWSSAGGSSITSDITEESVSEDTHSMDMTFRDSEDRGFYTETFHSSAWIYQGDDTSSGAIPPSLNSRTRAVSIRERTVRISKGTGEYPWGFRIQFSKPIVVTEVDTNGAAEEAGLIVGDYVLAVNGTDVTSIPHSEAADLARQGPDLLTLTVGSDIARGPNTPRPACRGYLHKRTQSGLIKGWRKRWFVLTHDCCLYYYRHKKDEGKRRALSAVKLEGAEVGSDISLGKPFVFKCRPQSDNRVYFFCATSNQEMKRWLEAMEKAIHPITQNHVWVDVTRHNSNLPPLAVKNPECLGLLHKMDKSKDMWVQHYCILKDGCLYLYGGIRSTHAHGGIYLQGYMVREQPCGSKKSTIELKPPSEEFRTFYLCAENPNENKRWIVAIKASIKKWLPLHQALQDYMNRPPEETRM